MPPLASTRPVTTSPRPPAPSTSVVSANPQAPSSSPPAMTYDGRKRAASAGAASEPIAITMFVGSIQRPAASGERPSTTWR